MTGSILPGLAGHGAGSFNSHPVHRATALLQEALHQSRRAALAREFAQARGIGHLMGGSATDGSDEASADEGVVREPSRIAFFLPHLKDQSRAPTAASEPATAPAEDDDAEFEPMAPSQLRGLVHDFRERQRQAGVVVAYSVGAAIVLTLIGLILLFATTLPSKAQPGAPFSVTTEAIAAAERVVALPGRPLALSTLLGETDARYVLLRGLPDDATLSAGRRTGPGAWMVKGDDLAGITMTFGGSDTGEHVVEIYQLDASVSPGLPRRLILRIDENQAADPHAGTAS